MKLPKRIAMTSALLATLLYGCASDQTDDPPTAGKLDKSEKVEQELGSVELRLSFPNGSRLDTLTYTINSFWGFFAQETLPVGDEATVSFQVGSLPAMVAPFSYTLALSAITSDGVFCSSSPVQFDVVAGETTVVGATLVCGSSPQLTTGSVRADVDIVRQPSCAYVAGISSPSLRARVGDAISLVGLSTVATTTFAWSVTPASAGTFTQPDAGTTGFVCAEAGTHELTLAATGDPGCEPDVEPVVVTCLPDETEPPPEG